MPYEFRLPDVGEGITEAEIVRWLVDEGAHVERDQPLVEIETDKAVVEVPSPVAGVITRHGGGDGDTLHVGDMLAVLEEAPTGAPPAPVQHAAAGVPAAGDGPSPAGQPELRQRGPLRPLATPAVRKLARELGVDLAGVTGSGPGGRIIAEDLQQAHDRRPLTALQAAVAPAPEAREAAGRQIGASDESEERVPLRCLRRRIAEAMAQSWRTIPHITGMDEVDVSALVALREQHQASVEAGGVHLTYMPFIVKAVIAALKQHVIVNAVLDEQAEEIVYRHRHNIGIATATPDGLIVPVLHDADQKSLHELQDAISSLSEQARSRRIVLADLQGGTFTITNFGALGGWLGTPIIRPGESAILGVGRIQERPWVVDGRIEARPILALSFSADHRLIDGDVATAFVRTVVGQLADPLSLFLDLA